MSWSRTCAACWREPQVALRHLARLIRRPARRVRQQVRRPPHPILQHRLPVERAGLPEEFIPHALRHCYASNALANGIPITEVSRWLGHKSIEVTHRIYGHLVPASMERARAILDDARPGGRRSDQTPDDAC